MKFAVMMFAFTLVGSSFAQAEGPNDIRSYDWTAYFNRLYAECLEAHPAEPAVFLGPIVYHDFDQDGRPEAIVTGSSCNTGTAGPDIHSVFSLNTDGSIREIQFSEKREKVISTGIPLHPIGNTNWAMSIKDGKLCNQFMDGAGAGMPMEECYEFRKGQFAMASIHYAATFETSFDCRKAKTDREIVACRNPEVAKLDLELARVYGALLHSLPEADKAALVVDQKKWLKKLDSWGAYKWIDEVTERYTNRIQVLRDYKQPLH